MTDNEKYKVLGLLQSEMKPSEIAEELNVSYGGVLKIKREYEKSILDGTVDKLINSDRVIIDSISEEMSLTLGADLAHDAAKNLTKGLKGLDLLQEELQRTAININNQVNKMIANADSIAELSTAADIVCSLNTSFLSKQITQVNIQNNLNGEQPKYDNFLGDKPSE